MYDSRAKNQMPSWALVLGLALPTAITLVYFSWLRAAPSWIQQVAFSTCKVLQFSFPVIAWFVWRPDQDDGTERPKGWPIEAAKGLLAGCASGLLIGALILAAYQWMLAPMGVMELPRQEANAKLREMGIQSVPVFFGLALFYSLIHSGLEEYYWRWFVFRRLQERVALTLAIVISSLGFMAHHVIVLSRFFGWFSPWTLFFSLSVAVGGAIWAVLYWRYRSLLGPWISHLMVDAAIFLVAYLLVGADLARG